jgi:AcrR family transcriptional regulator
MGRFGGRHQTNGMTGIRPKRDKHHANGATGIMPTGDIGGSGIYFAYLLVSKYLHSLKREIPPHSKRELPPTRDDILYLADDLIRRKGFNAFSYADIAGIMDIRNAAVHYHFPAKSDLGQAVVDREIERLRQYRRRTGDSPGDEQLKDLVSVFYRNSQLNNICLMGSLLPDFATFAARMQETIREMCGVVLDWMTDSLERARGEGKLRFEGAAADRAALVVSTLLSSLLLARALGQPVFPQMVDRLLQDLGAEWRVGDLPEVEWPAPESPSFT